MLLSEVNKVNVTMRHAIARCDRARREANAAATVVGRLNAITDEHATDSLPPTPKGSAIQPTITMVCRIR